MVSLVFFLPFCNEWVSGYVWFGGLAQTVMTLVWAGNGKSHTEVCFSL